MRLGRGIPRGTGKRFGIIFKNHLLILLIFSAFTACSTGKDVARKSAAYDPEATFQEVNEKIKKRDFEEARKLLEEIKVRDTSRKYSLLAQIRTGDTYFEEGLYEEAVTEYRMFLDLHTYHKYAPYAQYRIAMGYFKRIKGIDTGYSLAKDALSEFEKLRRRYPRNPYMELTEKRIAKCREILAEYEFFVGQFYRKKGSHRAAVQRFTVLLDTYPESRVESKTLYHLGLSYLELGEKEKARAALRNLIEKFPTIKISTHAKELLASLAQEE